MDKPFEWNPDKNRTLKALRGVSFEDDNKIFLKTIVPSRKANKKYNQNQKGDKYAK